MHIYDKECKRLQKHLKTKHGRASGAVGSKIMSIFKSLEEELSTKENEYMNLKKNFDKLQSTLDKSSKDTDKIKAEYEAKLSMVNQKYASSMSENISLTERNDILFKLSKTYLD